MCIVYLVALIFCITKVRCSSNTSKLIEDSSQSFTERMKTGKTSFIYFGNHVNPTIKLFLDQLEMSADALEDYGISVVKVNCSKETIAKYCTGEKLITKTYLLRGSEVLRSFDIDTVFDVSAIVSHVLFTVLYNEVRYVHTPAELLQVENAAKQMRDVVVGHIPVLGLPEHRALMEAAFVYGTKYQFVQTTGGPLLKHMGVDDLSVSKARLWFLHCKDMSRQMDQCPFTPMRKPLDTINIHTFLQLMEAPLVTEANVDPSEVDVVHNHLNVPVLYLFSHPQTKRLDRATAQTLALQLRGEVGVVLIHRDSTDVKTPLQYNAAYRLPQEDVKYFSLSSAEEVMKLFKEELVQDYKMVEDEDEEENEEHWSDLEILDDEVSESVYRDRDLMLDLESITELTSDNFQSEVTQNKITVVLFYFKWDAVCMAFMQTYIEVADALEGVSGLVLAAVDCGEWTDICSDRDVTSFPFIMIYRPMEAPQPYRGMLGTESLQRFILLSQISGPVPLSSSADVLSFLEGDLYSKHADLSSIRVLGLFTSTLDTGVTSFREAAKLLRGEAILGLFVHREAEKWVEGLSVNLPAVLLSRGSEVSREAYYLPSFSVNDLVSLVQRAVSDPFPELTVENLPWYLELEKPLLLLFVGKEYSTETSLTEMKHLLSSGQLPSFLPCWIHLGRTPVGRSVLEKYLGFVPPLPALVMSQLSTGGEVFLFPRERPLKAKNILQWLQSVENRDEHPAGVIPDTKWSPPVPVYDFLATMDQEAPGYASQRDPKMKTGAKEGHRDQDMTPNQRQTTHSSSKPQAPHEHSEL